MEVERSFQNRCIVYILYTVLDSGVGVTYMCKSISGSVRYLAVGSVSPEKDGGLLWRNRHRTHKMLLFILPVAIDVVDIFIDSVPCSVCFISGRLSS